MKIINIILILHICAAIDWTMTYQGLYPDKVIKIMERVGLIWVIQNIINSFIIIIMAIATFDGDELRAAIYRLAMLERGTKQEIDVLVDRIVMFKDAAKTAGSPAWVTKMCFSGMGATIAIWLLALIH